MASARRLIKNFLTLFAGNVIGQFFFFLALAHLARVLGPSAFGAWNFAQVWMLYLLRVGEFGLEVVGVRETSRDPTTTRAWISTVVPTRVALALALFLVAALLSATSLLPTGTGTLVLISALAVFPMAILLEWVYEARQELGLVSIARILKGCIFFVAVFLTVSTSTDGEKAAYLYIGSLAVPAIMVFAVVIVRWGFDWSGSSVRSGLGALRKSSPIGVSSLLLQYCLSIAPLTVGYLLSAEELGYFTSAHRIVLFLWAYIITSMHRILLPSLSLYFQESVSTYQRFVERFFRLSSLTAIPVGLVGSLVATPLMVLLFSTRYEASGTVFGIIVWAFVLASIRSILEIALIASDEQKRYMKGMVMLAIVYSSVTPLLTLKYGITGAAISSVVSELVYFCYLVFSFPHVGSTSLLRGFWKPILAAASVIAVLFPLAGLNTMIQGIIGLAVFVLVVVVTNGVTREDLGTLKALFHRVNAPAPT